MATNVIQDRLGDLFVREGLITEEQLQEALREARQTRTRIGFALVKLGFVAEDELTRALAKQFRVPAVDLEKVKVEEKILRLVPEEVALKHRVLPLRKV
jgi:type IV pilus assembly protein PilB